jgi:putative isomerase
MLSSNSGCGAAPHGTPTYWAARGAARYGRREQARALLEAALDDTAAQFQRTGTIWEFYSPLGGRPEDLKRKPQTKRNEPFSDYLGHNPMLAMARMWTDFGSPLSHMDQ